MAGTADQAAAAATARSPGQSLAATEQDEALNTISFTRRPCGLQRAVARAGSEAISGQRLWDECSQIRFLHRHASRTRNRAAGMARCQGQSAPDRQSEGTT